MPKRLITSIALLFSLVGASIALDRAHYRELQRKAAKLAQQKDWAGYKQTMLEIGHELPAATPRYMLVMASVEMHLGNTAEALRWMRRYAATGLTYDVAADDDLAALAKDPAFASIAKRMAAHAKLVENAALICSLPIADLIPEDLAYAPPLKSFFVSSVRRHGLHHVTLPTKGGKDCAITEVPLAEDAKRWPTLAVSWDATRHLIWLSTSAMPGFTDFPKEDSGKAALLAIDPKSGKIVRRLDLVSDSPAVLGDMSVAKDGTLFITDSIGGGVYRVLPGDLGSAKLAKIAEGLLSPQTPVLAADGKRLFVADYPIGVAVIDLSRSKRPVEYLKHSETVAMTGLDGLCLSGSALIGVENGTEPIRVVRYSLNAAQNEVTSADVVEQSIDRLGTPTHVIESGGWFYLIANVGWEKIDDAGKLQSGKEFSRPVLLRFPAH